MSRSAANPHRDMRMIECSSYKGVPDVGCAAHGFAICDWCDWVTPARRSKPTPRTRCGICGKPSQGYAQCKICAANDVRPMHLFDDDGAPNE